MCVSTSNFVPLTRYVGSKCFGENACHRVRVIIEPPPFIMLGSAGFRIKDHLSIKADSKAMGMRVGRYSNFLE
jgi:hypothetical protein